MTGLDRLHYWRDKQKREVDFVLDLRGLPPIAIECKWRVARDAFDGIHAFRELYPEAIEVLTADRDNTGDKKRAGDRGWAGKPSRASEGAPNSNKSLIAPGSVPCEPSEEVVAPAVVRAESETVLVAFVDMQGGGDVVVGKGGIEREAVGGVHTAVGLPMGDKGGRRGRGSRDDTECSSH